MNKRLVIIVNYMRLLLADRSIHITEQFKALAKAITNADDGNQLRVKFVRRRAEALDRELGEQIDRITRMRAELKTLSDSLEIK